MVTIKDLEIEGLKFRIGIREGEIVFIGFPAYGANDKGSVEWLENKMNDSVKRGEDPLFSIVEKEIEEYIKGERKVFDLPAHHYGTPFQKCVWKEIDRIPYGCTATYSDIARAIGCEGGYQAVGNAVGANMISILTPCHRVVAKSGAGGYAWGMNIKRRLNLIEQSPL
ncbi:MAG: methylated-DNA--[protein]-cysteine S-methyltransferase [Muribaculaceae bacterium]|nr:methylated-DNA--[protein]-cysteine S-methyltransferase [Muribaculaceae bacterium]